MTRKLIAIIAATLTVFALFPAFAASAAVNASASLQSPAEVFPNPDQRFVVRVTSNENPILGAANTANAIRLSWGVSLVDQACVTGQPTGWTCQPLNGGLLFRGVLAAGQTVDFPFDADVAAPNSGDAEERIRVAYSQNAGMSFTEFGDLGVDIRVLETVANSFMELAIPGSTAVPGDLRATAGQTVRVGFSIRNHAVNALDVTPTLTSNGPDQITTVSPTPLSVPGGKGTAQAVFDVATPASAERLRQAFLSGTASAATAQGVSAAGVLNVEGPADLALLRGTFSDPVVSAIAPGGNTYNFTIDADKVNLPAIGGLTGDITLTGPATFTAPLDAPALLPRGDAAGQTLEYGPITLDGLEDVEEAFFDVTFTFAGTDDNGAAYTQSETLEDLIRLDNLVPEVNLDPIQLPTGQEQIKSGDTITISGDVPSPDVPLPANLRLRLDTIDTQDGANTASYDVPQDAITITGRDFSAEVTLDDGTIMLPDLGQLTVTASVRDLAGLGDTESVDTFIDNISPALRDPARIISDPEYSANPVVEVVFTNEYATLVAGGCLPLQYGVTGTNVLRVLYSDGTMCQLGQPSPSGDNTRILVLTSEIDPDNPANVDYYADPSEGLGGLPSLGLTDPAVDGALNEALSQTVATISGIAPPLPQLINIDRADTDNLGEREDAVFAEDRYWVNRGGVAGLAPTAFVGGGKASFQLQVLNAAGTVIATAPSSGDNDTIDIPLPAEVADCASGGNVNDGQLEAGDCVLQRSVRFFNPTAAAGAQFGPAFPFTIVLDQILPFPNTAAVVLDGVEVTFNEVLFAGTNHSLDWAALERNVDRSPEEPEFFRYQADGVSGSGQSRTLDVRLGGNGPFAGADYEFFVDAFNPGDFEKERYEDYAGNRSPNSRATPAP